MKFRDMKGNVAGSRTRHLCPCLKPLSIKFHYLAQEICGFFFLFIFIIFVSLITFISNAKKIPSILGHLLETLV